LYGLPHTIDQAMVAVFPVPVDATASYRRGTARAPRAIDVASGQVDLHDLETGDRWRDGIAMAPQDPSIHEANGPAVAAANRVMEANGSITPSLAADLDTVNELGALVNDCTAKFTNGILGNRRIPVILGGDHSVPFGAIQAAARAHRGVGLLHVDAHADLRDSYQGFTWSHASILYNLLHRVPELGPVVSVGVRDLCRSEAELAADRVHLWTDPDLAQRLAGGDIWLNLIDQIISPLPGEVWISFDVDGLDPSLCPGTGTPVPGGLSWHQATTLLRRLAKSGRKIIGFDLCEVGPTPWDAIVGARLLYKLAGWAMYTHEPEAP